VLQNLKALLSLSELKQIAMLLLKVCVFLSVLNKKIDSNIIGNNSGNAHSTQEPNTCNVPHT
jgi:hypothetical protein